ncbi:hypothetical protein ACFFLM_19850 [Deinococcus oregonensis]|uniref:Uncharacterized protein n=1 Tax=Deinococcus oregonensis TaxID=1805970 RepID=A0ABV6B375_9DEIO
MTNSDQPTPDAAVPHVTIRHPAPDAQIPAQERGNAYAEVSLGNDSLERADPTEAPLPADDEA